MKTRNGSDKCTTIYTLDTILAVICLILGGVAFHYIRLAGVRAYDMAGVLVFEMALIFVLAVLMFVRILCQSHIAPKCSIRLNIVSLLMVILPILIACYAKTTVLLDVCEIYLFVLVQFICSAVYDLCRMKKHWDSGR